GRGAGGEMAVGLRALGQGSQPAAMLQNGEAVRDARVHAASPQGKALGHTLTQTIDEVRRAWIAATADDWLARNVPYCPLDEVRRLLAEPECAVLVTTKEGEF